MATPPQDSQVLPHKQNNSGNQGHHNPNQPANYMPSVRAASEKKLGLLHFSSPQNHGWHGDVRKRYVFLYLSGRAPPFATLHGSKLNLHHQKVYETPKLTADRFSDFLVNEIQKNGEVLHLTDYTVAPRPTDAVRQT